MTTHIVRVVSEEAFRGLTTGYVGPLTEDEAEAYASELEAHHGGEVEGFVEELHAPDADDLLPPRKATDADVLDRIHAMLNVPRWSGVEMLEWIAEAVVSSGRPIKGV